MTVSSTTSRVSYSGNGSTTAFAVSFYFLDNTHLKVILRAADGTETVKALTTDYTVSGAGNPAGGTVTMNTAPATGTTLVIVRNVPLTQETDYQANDPFPAESHERALDKLTMEVQQQQLQLDRSIKVPATTPTNVSTELPNPETNKLIGWNESATGLQNIDGGKLANIVAYGTARSDVFTGDGVQTAFTLSYNPGSLNNLDVSIDGATQVNGVNFTWTSGTTLTMTTAVPNGSKLFVRYMQGLPTTTADADDVQYVPSGMGARTVGAKLRETVSVKDFGAVGDGVTDDTAAIQAALNAVTSGVKLKFGTSTFLISDALSISGINSFEIDGEGATIIAADGMAVSSGKGLLYLTNCQKFRVENITFDANRANRTPAEVAAHTVTLENCKRFIFENVHSNNAVCDGYYFAATSNTDIATYCQYFQMIGCYANNCYRQGASVINAYDFQFIGGAYTNTTGTAPSAGIDVESNVGATVGNTRGSFIGVTFSGNDGYGLLLSNVAGSKTFNVQSCNFLQNAGGGIGVFSDQTQIRDSYFANHSGAGVTQGVVRFAAASTIKSGSVEGCTFENNTSTTGDIYTHAVTSGIRICNNRIQGSGLQGISLNGTNQVCADNVILSCGGVGIGTTAFDSTVQGNTIDACVGRGIFSSGTRVRILNNRISNISTVSGGYIQAAGTDPLVVGNVCLSDSPVSVIGIRVDGTALAVYSNSCINLDSTDPYSFTGSALDDIAYNNIGGTANDRRRVRFGMAVPSYTTGARPAAASVAAGQTIFNTTTNKLNTSDGSANWYNADGTVA